jgi:hypothetical protein
MSRLSLVIGFVRMVFAVKFAGLMERATLAPARSVILLVIGAVFLLVGAVLT